MKIRKGLILALGLLIESCNLINSTNSNIDLPNEYQDDKSFSTKLLNSSYIKDKLTNIISLSLIPAKNTDSQKRLVREINFYSLEDQRNGNSYYKGLYDTIISTTPTIHSSIIAMSQVITKRSQSVVFDNFLNPPIPLPSSPTAISPTNISPTSFRANWNSVLGATSYRISLNGGAYQNVGNVTSFNFTVLTAGTAYNYRVRSVNISGDSIDSNTVNLTTTSTVIGQFRVNTYTTGYQSEPSVAMSNNGDFIVTWTSSDDSLMFMGQRSTSVYAQRYNSNGVAQGSEFRVNTYTVDNQLGSSIAVSNSGTFIVTWSSFGQDGNHYGVYGQIFNSSGVAQGSEFLVNTYTNGSQYNRSVDIDNNGNFVVTWEGNSATDPNGIYARRYNSLGVAQADQFRVNGATTGSQHYSSIAMSGNGDFVISWTGQDADGQGVYAKRYNSLGVAQGSDLQVNTYTVGHQHLPSVGISNIGDFVITWASRTSSGFPSDSLGQDGSGSGVYAQRYDSNGNTQGSEFIVNTYTLRSQGAPLVSMNNTGNFVITWGSSGRSDPKFQGYGQRYNNLGVAQGTEFIINSASKANSNICAIAMDSNANFVSAFENSDSTDADIHARMYSSDGTLR